MRILILNWRDWKHPLAGGAELYTHEIAQQWVLQGHSVTLFCAAADGLADIEITEGMTVIRRGSRYSVYREARKYYQGAGRDQYDLVVDEVNTRPFLAPRYVKNIPVIALVHQVAAEVWNYEFPLPVALAGRYLFEPRWLRAYRDVPVVTVSDSSAKSLRDYGLDHVVSVPEGWSTPESIPSVPKESCPTIVYCGRLSRNKRPDHALQAFQKLLQVVPEARLWFLGSGQMLDELRRRNVPNVSFLGRVSHEEKFERMARAHALVITSVREGWGLVVSEAAAVGTVTVGYDVPGLQDSIPASGGVLVSPSPDALATELAQLLPKVMNGRGPTPRVGGVAPWSDVATAILTSTKIVDITDVDDQVQSNA